MEQLLKRIKASAWITLAGLIVSTIEIVLENLEVFKLSEIEKGIVIIIGTAIVSQITKYLNK